MNKRGLAIKVAVVAIVAAAGVGVVASPASAMDDQFCDNMAGTMQRMERNMQTWAVGSDVWNSSFVLWNRAASLYLQYDC